MLVKESINMFACFPRRRDSSSFCPNNFTVVVYMACCRATIPATWAYVCVFRFTRVQGMSPEEAFKQSSESITGPITKGISKVGIIKLYEGLDKEAKAEFEASAGMGCGDRRMGSLG